ncbi:MAG: COX15/CtaA family protein [Gammaproteobacteria bacterium]
MKRTFFVKLAMFATALAVVVVILGAYTRLSDAGLGCPDWPGCYGHLGVPKTDTAISAANEAFPHRPVEIHKAWKEMIHRYFAGALGLVILGMAIVAWRNRQDSQQLVALPILLVGIVTFQALLGMWTVTINLKPAIVMAHLMGGLTTLSLLWWCAIRQGRLFTARTMYESTLKPIQGLALLALVVVVIQIMLGGWTSANYAALACVDDFPTCHGQWWPPMDFKEGFVLWRGTEMNFEFGVLENDARIAIQVVHRIGAVVTLLVIGLLVWRLIVLAGARNLRSMGVVLLLVLSLQIALGIANVLLQLPLFIAVAHNAVGALLLLTVVTINHALNPRK